MGMRLMILMAMGLGAMYMMHLLAQDWNKIRRPVQQAAKLLSGASVALQQQQLRGKRDLHDELSWVKNANTAGVAEKDATVSNVQHKTVDWKRILSRDPFECLQSLICQVMAGAENGSEEAIMLMDFLESTLEVAPAKIGRAFSRGLAVRGATARCYDEYPFCLYSAKSMLRILRWFTDSGYTDVE